MRLPISVSRIIIEKMKEKARQSEGAATVALVVGWDVDALVSLQMLTRILDHQSIAFKISCVSSIPAFRNKMKDLSDDPTIRSIIAINVGAQQDLTQFAFPSAGSARSYIYVLDSHRPVHHANLSCGDVIVVLDDGNSGMKLCPSSREVELQAEYHRRIKAGDVEAAMSLDTPTSPSPSPALKEERKMEALQFGQKRGLSPDHNEERERTNLGDIQEKILNYYRGTFFAGPTAGEVYQLLRQLKLETRQAVWEWAVGLSDQLLHLRCNEYAYEGHLENIVEELGRLERKAEKGEEAKESEDELDQNQEENSAKVPTGKKGKAGSIHKAVSIKAPLLRYSTLRRAIEMSPYFYSSLRLERRDGKTVLDELLVRLGISLQDADQKYPFTKAKMGKGRLKDLLQKAEIRVQHFEDAPPVRATLKREFGHNFAVDAIDFALAVASTLENPNALMKELESKGAKEWGFGEEGITHFNADDERQRGHYLSHQNQVLEVVTSHEESNFVLAYELVREKRAETVQKALQVALESTTKIASAAGLLLEKKGAIFKLKHYCEGTLLAGKHTDGFVHTPLAQLRLLDFVKEVYSKKVQDALILLITQNPHTLALSAVGSPSSEIVRFDGQPMARNPWNQYFSQLDAPLIQGGPILSRRYIDPNFREVPMHDHLSFVIELSKLNAASP